MKSTLLPQRHVCHGSKMSVWTIESARVKNLEQDQTPFLGPRANKENVVCELTFCALETFALAIQKCRSSWWYFCWEWRAGWMICGFRCCEAGVSAPVPPRRWWAAIWSYSCRVGLSFPRSRGAPPPRKIPCASCHNPPHAHSRNTGDRKVHPWK